MINASFLSFLRETVVILIPDFVRGGPDDLRESIERKDDLWLDSHLFYRKEGRLF